MGTEITWILKFLAKSIKRVWMQTYPVLFGTFLWWFSIPAYQSGHPAVSFPPSGTWCSAALGDLCCQPARWLVFWQRCYRLHCYWEKRIYNRDNKLIIRLSIFHCLRADHNSYSERQNRMWFCKNSIKTYSISMLRSSTRAEKVPTLSSRNMLYLIHCCTSASELQSANVPTGKQNLHTQRELT